MSRRPSCSAGCLGHRKGVQATTSVDWAILMRESEYSNTAAVFTVLKRAGLLNAMAVCDFSPVQKHFYAVQGAWVTDKVFRPRTVSAGLFSEDRGCEHSSRACSNYSAEERRPAECHSCVSLVQKYLYAVQGAWVTEKVFRPRPVSAALFSERIESVNTATGAAVVVALKQAGLLNATDFLIEDPRYCSCSLCAYAAGMDPHAWLMHPLLFRAVPMARKFVSGDVEG